MEQTELANLFFTAAKSQASVRGVRFGEGADMDIRRFAEQGAELILKGYPQIERANQVVIAGESAFERLVDEMVKAAFEIEGYRAVHPAVIGEQTLARALSKLCPLFPIC